MDVKTMDAQTIFNTVATHLAIQGGPALNDLGHCQYRAPNGRKCAAGAMIPDDQYDPRMEGRSVAAEEVSVCFRRDQADLMMSLQGVHDNANRSMEAPGATWRGPWVAGGVASRLVYLAKRFELHDDVVFKLFPTEVAALPAPQSLPMTA